MNRENNQSLITVPEQTEVGKLDVFSIWHSCKQVTTRSICSERYFKYSAQCHPNFTLTPSGLFETIHLFISNGFWDVPASCQSVMQAFPLVTCVRAARARQWWRGEGNEAWRCERKKNFSFVLSPENAAHAAAEARKRAHDIRKLKCTRTPHRSVDACAHTQTNMPHKHT